MPATRVTVAAAKTAAAHRKVTISAGSNKLTLPITDPAVTLDDLGADWKRIGRPGQPAILELAGPGLKQMRLSVTLVNGGNPVDYWIDWFRWLSNQRTPLAVAYGTSGAEAGMWRLTSVTVSSVRRKEGSNAITQATSTLTFVEAVVLTKPKAATPPKTAPKKSTPKAPGKASRVYTVKTGDTLSGIALHFYGDANQWPKIARANKLRNPNRIYPGQRMVIP